MAADDTVPPHRTGPRVTALLRAAHPEPSLVVTVVTVGLGIGIDLEQRDLLSLGVAALAGQLSVGWSNDVVDARRGLDLDRSDKPVAAGSISSSAVGIAAGLALAVAVVASLMLGLIPALLHLSAVGVAWAYNFRLKHTAASIVAYALAFAALPAVVTTTAGAGLPRPWALLAATCFGAGVHLSNALPDIEADRAAGVRGLPQRLGEARSALASVLLLGVGAVAALIGPFAGEAIPAGALIALSAAIVLLVTALDMARRRRLEIAYQITVLVGLLVVGGLVASGGRLV